MPRPKKPGAPEPKKRSRNGCWPCKTRKVKCDESRPICQNCQRQGEICDYSIRLNWGGRSKKKAAESDTPPSIINFTAGMASSRPMKSNTEESERITSPSQIQFQEMSFDIRQGEGILGNQSLTQPDSTQHSQSSQGPSHTLSCRPLSYETSIIDPALITSLGSPPSMYTDSIYGGIQGRPEPQYTQSYERYRSSTPSTPATFQVHTVPGNRRGRTLEDANLAGAPSARNCTNSIMSNKNIALPNSESPPSTQISTENTRDNGDSQEQDTLRFDRPFKRARYLASHDNSQSYGASMPPPNITSYPMHSVDSQASSAMLFDSDSAGTPVTPASSHGDDALKDGYRSYPTNLPSFVQTTSEVRRLSVNSLLSGPPGISYRSDRAYDPENQGLQGWSQQPHDELDNITIYGIDRGFKDLDIGRNDDMNAITGTSPRTTRDHLNHSLGKESELMPIEFGFGMEENPAFETGAYYDKPVHVSISRALEPLPDKLLENPMNLLYFHHFLNHTAGCLTPHNCSSNPFRTILPQMAVQNDNLLNLLLAYSASHRARLLRQPEPATRIALWVQDIFPNLRRALDEPSEIISDSNLATAIMLASLEIICPQAFGIPVPWQTHLDTAREMIAARGGPQRMQTESRSDRVSSFLWSWFAYLDVLGSFSGGRATPPSTWILDYEIDEENDYQIDCILGFTSRCVRILSKIAELAKICDAERIGPDNSIREGWQPSEEVVTRADKLASDLAASRSHPAQACTHMQSTGEAAYQWDNLEMAATNEAFHWGGLVHLHRRILNKPSNHSDVQIAVREIFGALYKVRRGSAAEGCLLFPMFTAGCDTKDEKQRADIMERFKSVERYGMTQVHKARSLMERVWETGNPWETLMAGEFFG